MGFFASGAKSSVSAKSTVSPQLLHKLECRACSLNHARIESPKMQPTGDDAPLVYIIGEAPGRVEDQEGEQFVGNSGDLLRPLIPKKLRDRVRWNNVIRCITGDTLVSSPSAVSKIFRREFSGPLVSPVTRSGRVLSITQNHPVLTTRGWISADELVKGDYLICGADSDWEVIAAGPYKNNSPACVSEIFDSLSKSLVPQRIVGSRVDFHGDGSDSEIDIVSSVPELMSGRKTPTDKEIEQVVFAAAGHGFISGFAEGYSGSAVSDINTGFDKHFSDCSIAAPEPNSELVSAFASKICFDEVVDIKRVAFHGYVYNLETSSGWYIAEGAIIHNCWPGQGNPDPDKTQIECCRPSIIRDIEAARPAAIFGMGGVALSWTDKPSGIELWRGRRFPIRVGNHTCWYYAMRHPLFILHENKDSWRASDEQVAFEFDVRKAFADVAAGLPPPPYHTAADAKADTTCITGRSDGDLRYVLEFLDYAGECDVAGVDYETSHLRPYRENFRILTKAVSVKDETVAFAWRHKHAGWTSSQLEKLTDAWIRFLYSRAIKAVHGLSFEMEVTCVVYGGKEHPAPSLAWDVPWKDTLTQAFVLDERVGDSKPGALSLEFVTLEQFGVNIKKLFPGLNKAKMADEPLDAILPYNGCDAKYHRLNYYTLQDRIDAEGLAEVYSEKLQQVPSTVLSQIKGLPVDAGVNAELLDEYKKKVKESLLLVQSMPEAARFRKLTGRTFNPGSNGATGDVTILLRDILQTRKGQPSEKGWSGTEDVLKEIGEPITDAIIAWRKVTKLKSTYIDPLSPDGEDLYPGNLLHTNFGTCFTGTGRLQSDSPNLQNIPIRTEEGRKVRRQIQKKRGVVVSFDYGQIDARVIAAGSRDVSYCKALWEDYDIHLGWAKILAEYHPKWVGGKQFVHDEKALDKFRGGMVKNKFVFACFYGAALRTTAGRFGVTEEFMKPMYDDFWKQFKDVKRWQDDLMALFKEEGYVQLLGGLRRRVPLGKGQVINTPVQGGTNRIVMDAMNRLSAMQDPLLQPNLQIHDDLTYCFETEAHYWDCAPIILDAMLNGRAFPWFCVPLVVDIKEGSNWQDQGKVGTYSSTERLGWPVRAEEFY